MTSDRFRRVPGFVLLTLVAAFAPGAIPSFPQDAPLSDRAASPKSDPTNDAPTGLDAVRARTVRIQVTRRPKDPKTGELAADPVRDPIAGFLLEDGARVLTCGDALDSVEAIVVEAENGELRRGRGAHRDPQSGVGIVFVDPLPVVPLTGAGESPRDLEIGAHVLVCGDPANLGLAFTPATVSAFERAIEIEMLGRVSRRAGLIQLATNCDEGDRGGPVATREGEVVGLCLGPYRPIEMPAANSIAFALPIAEARLIGETLTEMAREASAAAASKTPRPWLGVWAADIEDPALEAQLDLEDGEGFLIENVFPDSPAQRAGILRFDVVSKIDGKRVFGTLGLRSCLKHAKVGQTIEIELIRKGKRQTLKISLGAGN